MSEEMWHVQIEPGEVKHLTLEQLDDMFRLDLISADTLVWQPGMAKALPLSVVAGMDDDEESDVMEIEPELLPEPAYSPRSVAPAAPASTGYRASASVSAWPAAPASASAYPSVVPAPAPAPVSVRPAAAPALASTYPSAAPNYASASGYPPVVQAPASVRNPTMAPPALAATALAPVAKAPIAAVMPSPDFLSPESLRPITMSDMPGLRGGGGGNMGKVLIGVAIAAGLLVTLYRNDLLRPMAESAGQKSAYESLESALGAPGFGTPQAVTQMSTTLNPQAAAALTDTTTPSTTSTTPSTTPSTTTTTTTTDSSDSSDSSDNVPASERGAAAQPEAKQSAGTTSTRRASGSAPAGRAKAKEPPKKGLKAYKGSEYDPMNAKL